MKSTIASTLIMLSLLGAVKAQHNTYYIGHSGFGWDLIVGDMVDDLAIDAGISTYDFGFQFIGGTCISNQWQSHATPQGGTDSWVELPTGNYDILVMAEQIPIQEVIYGSPWCATLTYTSVEAVDFFYDMTVTANPNTRIYLMEFHNEVDQTASTPHADWVALNAAMRPLWEQVADSVSLINTGGPNVCLVPVAAAFQALADSVIAGTYPGVTDWTDLFDPGDTVVATIHPTEVTYYLAACVHYATIFGQSPVGLTNATFSAQGWQYDPPTTAQALMMQEIAWEIVSNDSYACMPTQTGTNEVAIADDEVEINTYPNPVSKTVIIARNQDQFHNASLKLYNVIGEKLKHIQNINGQSITLDRGNLPSGIYFYQIHTTNGLNIDGKLIFK